MRILLDREIFTDAYEKAPQPPPYEGWELTGKHSKICPTFDNLKKPRKRINRRRTL